MIAAVKNEHSVDELSTPYKKILLNQIQQHLNTSLPTMQDNSPPLHADQMAAYDESSLSQSFDSAIGHRKKGIPCKYIADDVKPYSCDRCERVFEHRYLYERHGCFHTPNDDESQDMESIEVLTGEAFSCDRCEKYFETQLSYEQHDCLEESQENAESKDKQSDAEVPANREMQDASCEEKNTEEMDSAPSRVDDVVSAISERAEAVGTLSGIKGSAIAQVISGLLSTSKHSPSDNDNMPTLATPDVAVSTVTTDHRQSIST